MLVIFGANGRTGAALVAEAVARGLDVCPIVRNDRDSHRLDGIVPVRAIRYADPDHPASLPPVVEGATAVVSCIDPRTAGEGAPAYHADAGGNIISAAQAAGARTMLHMSVVGAYRWSPNRLNRRCFQLDRRVRRTAAPWCMVRVSCTIDEVIDGHVRPPDGRTPHPVPRHGRWAPISRRDVARIVLDQLPVIHPLRTLYIGGPRVYDAHVLARTVAPHRRGSGRRTTSQTLPPGDISVHPETTWCFVGRVPSDTLEAALDPASQAAPRRPFYDRPDPGPHPADLGQQQGPAGVLGVDLRRVVHAQLVADLARLGRPVEGVTLDFTHARRRGRATRAHDGELWEMSGVWVRDARGEVVHKGGVRFLRDDLAEVLECWWDQGDGVPDEVVRRLDLGVRRRAGLETR